MRDSLRIHTTRTLILCGTLGACTAGGSPQAPRSLNDLDQSHARGTTADDEDDQDDEDDKDDEDSDQDDDGDETSSAPDAGSAADGGAADTGASTAASGLPCEVDSFLATYCRSCHGSRPTGGAPMSLVTYADLSAPTPGKKGGTNAQNSLTALEDGTMPPGKAPPSAEVQTFAAWVQAGAPRGSCGTSTSDAGSEPAIADPYDTPSVCSSKKTWTGGNHESPLMHPGVACINCHARGEGPDFALAGTIFPSAHEPDDCYGASASGVNIVITDARGQEHTLTPNAAGNFCTNSIAKPYTAKVVYQGRTREMASEQTNGDCNSCHTESGEDGAPGRIMLP